MERLAPDAAHGPRWQQRRHRRRRAWPLHRLETMMGDVLDNPVEATRQSDSPRWRAVPPREADGQHAVSGGSEDPKEGRDQRPAPRWRGQDDAHEHIH